MSSTVTPPVSSSVRPGTACRGAATGSGAGGARGTATPVRRKASRSRSKAARRLRESSTLLASLISAKRRAARTPPGLTSG
ncbi:MAG TPA: hypothetical protein VGE42_02295 [Candidatus Dormibacteraeota bacterium]